MDVKCKTKSQKRGKKEKRKQLAKDDGHRGEGWITGAVATKMSRNKESGCIFFFAPPSHYPPTSCLMRCLVIQIDLSERSSRKRELNIFSADPHKSNKMLRRNSVGSAPSSPRRGKASGHYDSWLCLCDAVPLRRGVQIHQRGKRVSASALACVCVCVWAEWRSTLCLRTPQFVSDISLKGPRICNRFHIFSLVIWLTGLVLIGLFF